MQHLPQFLFIFTLFTASFGVSQVIPCQYGIAKTIVVDKLGRNGEFNTVQSAIDSIPSDNNNWIRIQINPGIYIEQITIPENKPCLIFEGQDRSVTTITYDAHEVTNTSATFSTNPDYLVFKGITFENSYNHPLKLDTAITQAVAAQIVGDKNVFYECGFVGLQDTLWDFQGRHYFYNCFIEGALDFIFGNGQSHYEDCHINVTAGLIPGELGVITAQGRELEDEGSGFVFRRGIVEGSGRVYLGRAYGPYSRVVFDETTLTSVVSPPGWDAWNFQGQEDHLVYAENDCIGAGSDTSNRVKWLRRMDRQQREGFYRSTFLDDQDGFSFDARICWTLSNVNGVELESPYKNIYSQPNQLMFFREEDARFSRFLPSFRYRCKDDKVGVFDWAGLKFNVSDLCPTQNLIQKRIHAAQYITKALKLEYGTNMRYY